MATSRLVTLLSYGLAGGLTSCAVIPTCPGSLLPITEIQVDDSASNHDDYGSTSAYTTCRARISNWARFGGGQNFPGGVPVEVRNPASIPGLVFSTAGGVAPGSASIFVTLPGNGDWLPFHVKGTSTNARDKSSIIEMSTAGSCDEVVLARKAMMVPAGPTPIPALPARPRVELEIGSVSTLDDYIAWAPVSCRIRWLKDRAGGDLKVTLRNMPRTDRLRFANSALPAGSTATNDTLGLVLNGNGSWQTFYIAGNFDSPSRSDKDAVLEVVGPLDQLLSREGLMVRVRKNANSLSEAERNRYLEALKKLDLTYDDYIDFVRTHSRDSTGSNGSLVSHRQAHSGSAFLPWHRAFVLHLERLLQAADPSVALPYWKFDASAPNVFTPDFMGANSTGNFATLAATNPIVSWTLPLEGVATGIQRRTPYGDSGNPAVASETATLGLGSPGFTYASFKGMEGIAHNPAHFESSFDPTDPTESWIGGSPAVAPRDPLFFLLHCNVDRLWAKWQWLRDRNNPTDVASYDLQGSHASPAAGVAVPAFTQAANGAITANRTLGQYADDSMWPWDNVIGGAGTAARPDVAILTPFPITLGGVPPLAKPTVRFMIDYVGVTATGGPGLSMGFGYDDVFPF